MTRLRTVILTGIAMALGCAGAPHAPPALDSRALVGSWVVCEEVWAVEGWLELREDGAYESEWSAHRQDFRHVGAWSVRGDTLVFHTKPAEGVAEQERRRYRISRRDGRLLLSLDSLRPIAWWVKASRGTTVRCT